MLNFIKVMELNSVVMVISMKYKVVNIFIVMRSGMVRCFDLVDMFCCVMVSFFDCYGWLVINVLRKYGKDNSFFLFLWKII